jgi:hypothetical protein
MTKFDPPLPGKLHWAALFGCIGLWSAVPYHLAICGNLALVAAAMAIETVRSSVSASVDEKTGRQPSLHVVWMLPALVVLLRVFTGVHYVAVRGVVVAAVACGVLLTLFLGGAGRRGRRFRPSLFAFLLGGALGWGVAGYVNHGLDFSAPARFEPRVLRKNLARGTSRLVVDALVHRRRPAALRHRAPTGAEPRRYPYR